MADVDDRGWGWRLLMDDLTWQPRESIASDFGVVYPVPGRLLDAIWKSGLAAAPDADDCPERRLEQFQVHLPSGFFNFIESMRELDAYTYAVFPKNDVRGVLREMQSGGGAGGPGGGIGFLRRLAESRTEPLLVGFGDAGKVVDDVGDDAGDDAVVEQESRSVSFGWVIASPERMQPSLKTQLALVSVPAWTKELTIDVTTGWLDRTGRRHQVRKKNMAVKLPPDYGAFDSIFRGEGWVTPAPQIRDQDMDQAIYVVAGQDANVLIPVCACGAARPLRWGRSRRIVSASCRTWRGSSPSSGPSGCPSPSTSRCRRTPVARTPALARTSSRRVAPSEKSGPTVRSAASRRPSSGSRSGRCGCGFGPARAWR